MLKSLTIHQAPLALVKLPALWYQNNPVKTHFFNAMSTLFPQGENFFIWTIKNFSSKFASDALQAQIRDFVVQEKNHAALHKSYNRCLARAGYNIARMEDALHKRISFAQNNIDPLMCLAFTVATEHITAVLGEKVLQGHLVDESCADELRKLWIWHAMEEVDHKAVAMDLFLAAGGSYWQRVRAMIYISFSFWGDSVFRMFHMLYKDKILHKPKTWLQLGQWFFGSKGIFAIMVPDILRFFSPKFHPNLKDDEELLVIGRKFLSA